MTRKFMPVLMDTCTWHAYTWLELRENLERKFLETSAKEIYEEIKDDVDEPEDRVMYYIDAFKYDVENASGTVVAMSEPKQKVIKAIIDRWT